MRHRLGPVMLAVAVLVACRPAKGGLMAYWPLDEASGQVANDWTGVNHGRLGSTTGPDANDPLVNQAGRIGTAYSFDGTNDYVEVPHHASIGANVRSALTLSMWLNPTVALGGGTRRALEKGDAYFFLEDLATGGMNFLIKQNNTNRVVGLKENLAANTWYHLAAQFDGAAKQMSIYLNGGLKNTLTVPDALIDDDGLPLRIGSDDSGRYFPGRLDDVAIYDHLLTPYQIIALAQGGSPAALPATPAPLITSVTRTGGTDPVAPVIRNSALAENALAYADRTHEWNVFPAAHPELVGSDYIQIANDDRDAANLRLNVGLARPSTLYLFRDSRLTGTVLANMNQWMSAYGFKGTGQSIWLDESGDGSANTRFDVFRGNFPAGSVDLFAQNTPGANALYGVAAVEQLALPSAHAYTPFGTGKTFLEQSGQVVVEAENYCSRALVAGGADGWFIVPDERGPAGPLVTNARGGKYVQSLPDDLSAGGPAVPPSISYDVVISTPGQYRLYLRWDGNTLNTGQSDSIFVDVAQFKDGMGGTHADWYELDHGIDGNFATDPGMGSAEPSRTWRTRLRTPLSGPCPPPAPTRCG
ncbi:MAG: LamG domain-containing protein [Planctomycetes bacterium]|nr:LamG domain-containing protein [Planctomycetota bacterium]